MPTNFPGDKNVDHIQSVKGPSERVDEHGFEKPAPHPFAKSNAENPGYETSDVNTKGVVVFLGGLIGFIAVFFVLCYAIGKAINFGLLKQDQDEATHVSMSSGSAAGLQRRGASLENNPAMEQIEAARMTQSFPTPRLEADDSNQSTADMHAREDLLLEHTTAADASDGPAGTIHIPIERAMQLIVQRGLPTGPGVETVQTKLTGDAQTNVLAPLTNGFARTAFELEQIESRQQRMKIEKGEK